MSAREPQGWCPSCEASHPTDVTYPRGTQGTMKMVRVSVAATVGECWLCGHGKLWHRLTSWWTKCVYDPIREESYAEFKRLTEKYAS